MKVHVELLKKECFKNTVYMYGSKDFKISLKDYICLFLLTLIFLRVILKEIKTEVGDEVKKYCKLFLYTYHLLGRK